MEPRTLIPASSNSLNKDLREKNIADSDEVGNTARSPSLNNGISNNNLNLTQDPDSMTLLESISLQLARRKSLQHTPLVSSPLARKSWTTTEP